MKDLTALMERVGLDVPYKLKRAFRSQYGTLQSLAGFRHGISGEHWHANAKAPLARKLLIRRHS